jgi:hypothetical protein
MDPYKIEDPWPMNPIDYYDNDDGFWDDYIKRKREKYAKVPLYAARTLFIH